MYVLRMHALLPPHISPHLKAIQTGRVFLRLDAAAVSLGSMQPRLYTSKIEFGPTQRGEEEAESLAADLLHCFVQPATRIT